MNKKTILHLIDTTGPGGAETVFIQLADQLRQHGYQSIVVIRGPGWVKSTLEGKNLDPIIIPAKGSFAVGFLLKLVWLVLTRRVDIIQSHLLGSNVYAAMVGWLTRTPVVATYHGMVDVGLSERFRGLKHAAMAHGVARYVVVSKALFENIKSRELLDASKTTVIYNGVDPNRYAKASNVRLIEQLDLPSDSIIVGSLGNIRPAKAYDVLIRAARIVADNDTRVHFVIAGDPKESLMRDLLALADELNVCDHMHFIGYMEDSASFLASLDLFVLCSESEGFSISTIEAMMTGLPVIATRCGGPEEILTDGDTGLLVPVSNPEELAKGITYLSENREQAGRLASRGSKHAAEVFGLEQMVDEYIVVYDQIA